MSSDESLPQKSSHASDDATRFASEHSEEHAHDADFELSEDAADRPGLVGVVGEYLLLEPIGAGGMGQVFRAEHRTMNREVALKILSHEIADQPRILEQFFAEVRAVAKLMHPNIVTAFDAGTSGSIHFLVMELVDGEVLSSKIRERGPLSTGEAVSVLEQAAQALAYAHSKGIVHRDVKPGNMMLTTNGVLKILDFGLARLSTSAPVEASSESKKIFMGTPEYMSPEQIENPEKVDGRSDLYSLGATLYFLLTGKPMFAGEKMQVARAQLHERPKPLFIVRSDVDLRLDSIFQRLVAKRPEDRYASAEQLLENLAELNLTSQTTSGNALQKGAYRLAKDSPTSAAFSTSTLARKSQIVAIDLGLLTTAAAIYDPQVGPQIIGQGEDNLQQLRNMLWSSGEQIRLGQEAVSLRQVDPDKIFHSVQRWIGQGVIARGFAGRNVRSEVLLAALLKYVMQNCSAASDGSQSAIVTVPSCYDQLHRRAIVTACEIAGIELVQLLDKPLAACLAWMDLNSRLHALGDPQALIDQRVLVVQLAGTGLDASVLHAQGNTARQLGTSGHWTLGSQRWQQMLAQYFSDRLKQETGKSIREDVAAATRLQRTIEIAMQQLTRTAKVEVRFDWLSSSVQQVVTQEGLVKIAPDLTSAIQQSIARACEMAKVDLSDIDHILLAGSMMHMRPIQKIVTNLIPHDAAVTCLDKLDFARGAAIQANYLGTLATEPNVFCGQSCTAHDIALVTTAGGHVAPRPRVLIQRGAPLPVSHSRTIRPKQVGEESHALPSIQLIESSNLGAADWTRLSGIDLNQAFPQRAASDDLQLRLDIDQNGILDANLFWPKGGEQIPVRAQGAVQLAADEIASWRDWLATAMLCSNS